MAIQVVLNGTVANVSVARIVLDTVTLPYDAQRLIDALEANTPYTVAVLMAAIEKAINYKGVNYFYTREQLP